jgi:hypothetical protein
MGDIKGHYNRGTVCMVLKLGHFQERARTHTHTIGRTE